MSFRNNLLSLTPIAITLLIAQIAPSSGSIPPREKAPRSIEGKTFDPGATSREERRVAIEEAKVQTNLDEDRARPRYRSSGACVAADCVGAMSGSALQEGTDLIGDSLSQGNTDIGGLGAR